MSRAALTLSALACGNAGLLYMPAVHSAEWLVSPNARVAADYTDNPRLLREGGESSDGEVGELSAKIVGRTERTELSLQPRLRSSRYSNDAALESDDQYLSLALTHAAERTQWSASADLTRDTTLTSELGSTGIVQANRRHEGLTLSAGPSVALTDRINVGGQLYWMDNHYVDARFTGLVDYEYRSASIFSSLVSSELSSLTLTARGSELTVPDQQSNTQDATLRLSWRYQPWRLWTFEASAGPSYVKADYGTDSGEVFDIDLQRQGELWTIAANAGRELAPTGRGVLTQRDQIAISLNRRITERLSGGIAARWIRNQDLLPQPGIVFQEIVYSRLDLHADWHIAEHWSVALALGGASQEYDSLSGSAENYRASLSIVWNGQTQSL